MVALRLSFESSQPPLKCDCPRNVTVVSKQAAKIAIWVFDQPVTVTGPNVPQLTIDRSPGTGMSPVSVIQDSPSSLLVTYNFDIQVPPGNWGIFAKPINIDPATPIAWPQSGTTV